MARANPLISAAVAFLQPATHPEKHSDEEAQDWAATLLEEYVAKAETVLIADQRLHRVADINLSDDIEFSRFKAQRNYARVYAPYTPEPEAYEAHRKAMPARPTHWSVRDQDDKAIPFDPQRHSARPPK